MAAGRIPDLPISINSVSYWASRWQTVQQGETLQEVWRDGWQGGAGEFRRKSRDGFYVSKNMDASMGGNVRLRPAFTQDITAANADFSASTMYAFVALEGAAPGSGTQYIYVLNGRYGFKFSATGATLHSTIDFGAGASCGRPAYFEGSWHIPLGGSVVAKKLTTVGVGAGADTLTAIDNTDGVHGFASHFAAPLISSGTGQIWAAGTGANAHKVWTSGDTSIANGGFAGVGEVGESGLVITDLQVIEGELLVAKQNQLYRFDTNSNAYTISKFIPSPPLSRAGYGITAHGSYIFWPHLGRLYRLVSGSFKDISPPAAPDWADIVTAAFPSFTFPTAAGTTPYSHGDTAAWGEWLYWCRPTEIWWGRIDANGIPIWFGALFSSATVEAVDIVATSTGGVMLVVGGSTGATQIGFIALDDDGSPRGPALTRGKASETAEFVLPATDFGRPNEQKQLRRMWARLFAGHATAPVQLGCYIDAATSITNVGATITAAGYADRLWTPGTTDTAYRARATVQVVTTAGYTPSASATCIIEEIGIEALTEEIIEVDIPVTVEGLNATSGSIATVMQVLRNLVNSGHYTIADPWQSEYSMDTFSGTFIGYSQRALAGNSEWGRGYMVTLRISRFQYGS